MKETIRSEIVTALIKHGEKILLEEDALSGKYGTYEDALFAFTAARSVENLIWLAEGIGFGFDPDRHFGFSDYSLAIRAYAKALEILDQTQTNSTP